MKHFTLGKVIRREITIRSSDRALPNTDWILTFSEKGVEIRRKGKKEERFVLSWRSVISHAIIHSRR